MIIYFILVLLIIIFRLITNVRNKNKGNKLFLILCFIAFSLVAALRSYTVGADTPQYYRFYTRIMNLNSIKPENYRYEYGFTYLVYILRFFKNPQYLIAITSIFINYVIFKFIYNNSINPFSSTIIYLFLNSFFSYMNIMREAIAIAFILIGYEYLKKNKILKFIIFNIIATYFHFSSILGLLLIPVKKVRFNKKTGSLALILIVITFILGNNIFVIFSKISPKLSSYLDNGEYTFSNFYGSLIIAVLYLFIYLIGLLCLKKYDIKVFSNKNDNMNTLVGIMSLTCIFQFLVVRVNLFGRFAAYFSIFSIIWLPNCLSLIKNNRKKMLINIIVYFILFSYWVIIMVYRPEWYFVVPYSFFC